MTPEHTLQAICDLTPQARQAWFDEFFKLVKARYTQAEAEALKGGAPGYMLRRWTRTPKYALLQSLLEGADTLSRRHRRLRSAV